MNVKIRTNIAKPTARPVYVFIGTPDGKVIAPEHFIPWM